MSLSDITVIIFSKGREEVLRRSLEYWAKQEMKVVIFHNTTKPLQLPTSYRNIRYTVATTNYGSRCSLAANSIETSFAILCADDEFYLKSGLQAMLQRLEQNSELSSIGAQTIAIGGYGPIITGTRIYANMTGYVNNHDASVKRLYEHFDTLSDYKNGSVYRLMRSKIIIKLLQVFSEVSEISTPYIYEVTGELLVTSMGKSEYINQIYWIRNWIVDAVSHSGWDRNLYFHEWATNPKFKEEFETWRNIIIKNLPLTESEIDIIFEMLITKRTKVEKQEIYRATKRKVRLTDNWKYRIRKCMAPKTIPKTIGIVAKEVLALGTALDTNELNEVLKYFQTTYVKQKLSSKS
jgi:glycosyltransferase domain-containing protein